MTDLLTTTRDIVSQLRIQKENPDRDTVRTPLFSVPDILRLLAASTSGHIYHIYPILSEEIRPRGFDLTIWRQFAKRGKRVHRIYAIPHSGFAKTAIDSASQEDSAAGVEVSVVTLSAIPQERQLMSVDQYIISPNEFVFHSDEGHSSGGSDGDKDWILSRADHNISNAMSLFSTLKEIAANTSTQHNLIDLEEPLVLSADLINGVANVLCSGDHIDHDDCSWYHGAWQYMRLLDLVSTPTWHDSFYRGAFVEFFRSFPEARVLISGTADYSLFAYITSAARIANASPTVYVLDHCATPLFACRWFAKRCGMKVVTIQADIFDVLRAVDKKFDLVTSDAFLTRFGPDDASRITGIWFSLLNPGGRIVTTVRLHDKTVQLRNQETAVLDFVTRARSRIHRWKQFIRPSTQTILAAIELYARRMVSNKIGDEDNILRIFADSGLSIVHSDIGDVPGELYPTVYLRVVAERLRPTP